MKAKIRLYSKAFRLALLFLAGLLIAGGLFPALGRILTPVRFKRVRDAIKLRWLQAFGRILNLRAVKTGQAAAGPALIVGNHISWLDIIVLGQYAPGCFAAKSEIAGWPVIGYLSRQAGTVFIRRGDKKQILQTTESMAWQLRQGGNILVFPEGTTTDGSAVLDFHASLFQPALLTKSTVQPVAVRYSGAAKAAAPFIGDDEFVAHLLKMLALEAIEVSIDFLPPLDSDGKTRNTVSSEARHLLQTVLAADGLAGTLPALKQKVIQAP